MIKITLTPFIKKSILLILITAIAFLHSEAQQNITRIQDKNSIAWLGNFFTFKLKGKWGVHAEYQVRRANFISGGQQNLFRTGINYQANNRILLRLGYANAFSFPYGQYPINSMGKSFSEQRIFEMISLEDRLGSFDLTHRLVLEQRWIGRYSSPQLTKQDEYNYVNRARYLFRIQKALRKNNTEKNLPYLAMYDEIFIGFGKNLGENIFDQNRFSVLAGIKINNKIKIEAGYLSQIVQLGRRVDSKTIFQYNNGVFLNVLYNINCFSKSN